MSTIEYARMRDFEQQLDYEEELYGNKTLEEKELDEFKQRCRQSKVSATKLMKYERELYNATEAIKMAIVEIQNKMLYARGTKLLERQLAKKYEELERTEQTIYDKYFKKKK